MKSGVIIAVVLVVVVAGGVFVATSSDDNTTSNNETTQTETNDATNTSQAVDTPETATSQLIKLEEVAANNTADSCWTIIDSDVYDITDYAPNHPAGTSIFAACGNDSTSLFRQRMTAEGDTVGSGTPHSSRAEDLLPDFKIGTLDTTVE